MLTELIFNKTTMFKKLHINLHWPQEQITVILKAHSETFKAKKLFVRPQILKF